MDLNEISQAVENLEKDKALELVQKALDEGVNPPDIINSGIVPGLQGVGKKFETEEYFLAELMMGGKVSQACIELVEPHLPDTGGASKGHVRADVFWGRGDEAEKLAGLMKQQGRLFVLLPKDYPLDE